MVNKIDFLSTPDRMIERGRELSSPSNARVDFSIFAPEIFSVSSRKRRSRPRLDGWRELARRIAPRKLDQSRFPPLESYLVSTLDEDRESSPQAAEPARCRRQAPRRSKLSPKWTDGRSAASCATTSIGTRRHRAPGRALRRRTWPREFRFRPDGRRQHPARVRAARSQEYFDETLRLTRAFDLLNKAKIKADFERQVIGDAPQVIEEKVNEIIDWMVASELRQWKAVTDSLEKRRTHHGDRVVGTLGGFDYDRNRLLDSVGRAAHRTVDSYDRETEATRMADSVQAAVAGTALIEVGALGLGAIVTMLATTQVADVTASWPPAPWRSSAFSSCRPAGARPRRNSPARSWTYANDSWTPSPTSSIARWTAAFTASRRR